MDRVTNHSLQKQVSEDSPESRASPYFHSEVWEDELILQRQLEIDYALDSPQTDANSYGRTANPRSQEPRDVDTYSHPVNDVFTNEDRASDRPSSYTPQTFRREMELMGDTASRGTLNKNEGSQVIRSAKTEKPLLSAQDTAENYNHLVHWCKTKIGRKWRAEHE